MQPESGVGGLMMPSARISLIGGHILCVRIAICSLGTDRAEHRAIDSKEAKSTAKTESC